jgi:hypothetical protein
MFWESKYEKNIIINRVVYIHNHASLVFVNTVASVTLIKHASCMYPYPEGFIAANMTVEYKRAMDPSKIIALIIVGKLMKRKMIIISNNAHL